MAANGALGVGLLAIPVVVAATIGLGGASGLSSLAAGPGEGALGQSSDELVRSDQRLEKLAEALPTVSERAAEEGGESAATPEIVGPGSFPTAGDAPTTTAPVTGGDAPSDADISPIPIPTTGGDDTTTTTTTTGGGETTTDPGIDLGTTLPTGNPNSGNLIDQLLGGLTGSGTGQ